MCILSENQLSLGFLVEVQKNIESKYDNRHIKSVVKGWLLEHYPQVQEWELPKELTDRMFEVMYCALMRHKRISVNAIVEMLAQKQDIEGSVDLTVKAIVELVERGTLLHEFDSHNRLYVKPEITLTDESWERLEQYQYRLPMLVQPLPTNEKGNNKGSGYYLKQSDSLILNQVNPNIDIDSKCLDRFNSIPFTLNKKLIKNIRNKWKALEEEEQTKLETEKNFLRYEKAVLKASAFIINHGNKFYFTHKYDKRGRVYSCGYQINYQSNSYAKAQVEFANKQVVTDEINFFGE